MTKRPSILFVASLVALLALITVVLGPGRPLASPESGSATGPRESQSPGQPGLAGVEQLENQLGLVAQVEELTTPPFDRAIDWGPFRIIPMNLWEQEVRALNLPTFAPVEGRPQVSRILSLDQAMAQLPVIYKPADIPLGFALARVRGSKIDDGAIPLIVGGRAITTTSFDVTLEYVHADGRTIAITQSPVGIGPQPLMPISVPVGPSPRVHPRLGFVQGQPAFFRIEGAITLPGTSTVPATTTVAIRWVNNGLLFNVAGSLVDLEALRRVAETMQ